MVRDWNILHLIFDGEVECQTDADRFTLSDNTLIWLPPGMRLAMSWSRPFSFTEFRFRLWRGKQQYRFVNSVYLNSSVPVIELWRTMQQINDELLMLHNERELMLRTLLAQLLVRLIRGADNHASASGTLNQAQRHWLKEFTQKNHHRRPAAKELADGVQLSPDYFTRVFRRTYGVTPSRWILEERMQAAGRLLHESTLNVSEISEKFGYTDVALFSRQFKKIMGSSPLRFRNAHG
jgi:AraC-like DNA-binding protein